MPVANNPAKIKIFMVEWSTPSDQDLNVTTLWSSLLQAQQDACNDILGTIRVKFDLTDPKYLAIAKSINNSILCDEFKLAIEKYNFFMSNEDFESQNFFSISTNTIDNYSITLTSLTFDDEEIDISDAEFEEGPYVASTPGAVCRGPCGNSNEYAYADQRDGTHLCYQCKMMSQVFGGSIT